MQNKKLVFATILALIVVFVLATLFYKGNETQKIEEIASNNSDVFTRDYSYKIGDNKKNITVVEFMDPECESCAYFHTSIRKLYKEHSDDIQIVTKYLANHQNSKFAIQILEASRQQNVYDEVLNVMFEKLPLWAQHNNEKPELLWEFLKVVPSLDFEKLKNDMKDPRIDEIIAQDKKDATVLKITGTPTLFVNGVLLESLSEKALFNLVEKEIYK